MARSVKALSLQLNQHSSDYEKLKAIFVEHLQSGHLGHFVSQELAAIGKGQLQVSQPCRGQRNFMMLSTKRYDYVVRLYTEADPPTSIKWTGDQHVMGVKGQGHIRVRILEVPESAHINHFAPNLRIRPLKELTLRAGDITAIDSDRQILQIMEVCFCVVAEILTVKSSGVQMYWTFSKDLRAFFSEPSSLTVARLRNVLEVARKMEGPVPALLYEAIFRHGDTQLKLTAIQSLLIEQDISGLHRLYEAISSGDLAYSEGGREILAILIGSKSRTGQDYAGAN